MWRERRRPRAGAWGVGVLGCLALVCWHLADASPSEEVKAPPSHPSESFTGSIRLAAFLPTGASGGELQGSSFATRPASLRPGSVLGGSVARPQEASAEPEAASSSVSSTPVSVLPETSSKAPDVALPLSGMRCTREGNTFTCGECRTDGDCPRDEGCVANRETRRFECMASECEEDAHCFPGLSCRAVTDGASGSVIRRCQPEGQRRVGERCISLPVTAAESCAEGLRCVNQVCTTPCRLEDPASCSVGSTCTDGLNGPGCFPDCRQQGCADGEQCTRVRESEYRCLKSAQGDCRDTPCPEGQRCNMRGARGHAVFWCAALCNPLVSQSCGEGQVCGRASPTVSTCFRQCDPAQPEACGPGWTCSTVSEDMTLWGCRPDLPR
jgi:hypothetical protein